MTRATAWLFVAGWAVFWVGAFTPPWRQWVSPLREALEIIGMHRPAWHFIHVCFVVGALLTAAAFIVNAGAASSGRARTWATLAASAYVVALTLFFVNLAFRNTVQVWAAESVLRTGELPSSYETWHRFAGLLFGMYSVLAYTAVAALGASWLDSTLLPRWIVWGNLGGGFALTALMLGNLPPANAPLMVHLAPGLAGLVLLLRGGRDVAFG
jgi:hypothetical protein